MTRAYLQNLAHGELIDIATRLHILPHNFREIRHAHSENQNLELHPSNETLLGSAEQQDLIDEIYDILIEQHSESLTDLSSPLMASLHKFEIELDGISDVAKPLPCNYFADQLGMTKNKLHLILRDMEWAVIFWQLSTNIQRLIEQEERKEQQFHSEKIKEASLSITVHESPTMPKFGRQSKLDAVRGDYKRDYYIYSGNLQSAGTKTESYFFSISSQEYKRYIFLKNDYNYYWAELYHYNQDYQNKVLLARSAILYKPKLLQIDEETQYQQNSEKTCELFELSNGSPERLKSYISKLSNIA